MKVAVVGLGVMGRAHARVLKQLGHEVVTVDCAGPVGAQLPTVEDAAEAGCDAAVISVPPMFLFTEAWEAAHCCMDVLVEKPVAHAVPIKDTVGHARKLRAFAIEQDVKLAVGYVERHNPAVVELKKRLGSIGEVRHIRALRLGPISRAPTPVALDLATHDIDVLRYLGWEPKLTGASGNGSHVTATFDLGGPTATLEASHLHPVKVRQLEVIGTDGMIRVNYQKQTLVDGEEFVPVSREEPLVAEWKAFPDGCATIDDGIAALSHAVEIVGACR